MLVLCCVVVVLLLLVAAYERTTATYKATLQLEGAGIRWPIIGNLYLVLSYTATSGFTSLRKLALQYKSGFIFYMLNTLHMTVHTAEAFEKMLTSPNTTKGMFYDFLHPYIGTGLLTSRGTKWFERRRLISPSFHFRILNRFFETFKSHTDTMIDSIKSRQSERIHVNSMFSAYSMGLICETSMGIPISSSAEYEKNLAALGDLTQHRIFSPYLHSDRAHRWFGYKSRCDRVIAPMHAFARDLIEKRRVILDSVPQKEDDESGEENSNIYLRKNQSSLLDALLKAKSQTGVIDDAGIEEEVNTFIFTGHDTITAAMTYTMLCIGEHPEVQLKLYEEIKTIVQDDELTPSHLNSCTYMDMVVKESLRLLPPVPFIFRTLDEDLVVNGVTLPPGTDYQMSIFSLHRDPRWFPEPDKFIPERFLPEQTADRHRFAYLPFSAGLRNCIGQKYALIQMKTMIVKMLQQYRLESVTKLADLEFIMDMILHTKRPVEIKFHRRGADEVQ